jgi:hypothetical protein
MPPYSRSPDGRGAGVADGSGAGRPTLTEGRAPALAGRVTSGRTAGRGFTAVVRGFTAAVLGLAVLLALAAVFVPALGFGAVFGRAVVAGLDAVRLGLAAVVRPIVRLAVVLLAVFTVLDLAAARDTAAAGFAADMVFAATLSALAAVVIALVAVFSASRAVDMVLADDLALVAAWLNLVAAEVTFTAADETVVTADADVGVRLAAVLRVAFTRVDLVLTFLFGLLAPRLTAPPVTDLVRPKLAGLRRAAVRVLVCTGTALPPY